MFLQHVFVILLWGILMSPSTWTCCITYTQNTVCFFTLVCFRYKEGSGSIRITDNRSEQGYKSRGHPGQGSTTAPSSGTWGIPSALHEVISCNRPPRPINNLANAQKHVARAHALRKYAESAECARQQELVSTGCPVSCHGYSSLHS